MRKVIQIGGYTHAGKLYWFVVPDGLQPGDPVPPGVEIHGPFDTEAEAFEDQRRTLLGPDCEMIDGGKWDSSKLH